MFLHLNRFNICPIFSKIVSQSVETSLNQLLIVLLMIKLKLGLKKMKDHQLSHLMKELSEQSSHLERRVLYYSMDKLVQNYFKISLKLLNNTMDKLLSSLKLQLIMNIWITLLAILNLIEKLSQLSLLKLNHKLNMFWRKNQLNKIF